MSHALGDYIHLKWSSYLDSDKGIAHTKQTSYAKAYAAQKSFIQSEINKLKNSNDDVTMKKLENMIKKNPLGQTKSKNIDKSQRREKLFVSAVEDKIHRSLDEFHVRSVFASDDYISKHKNKEMKKLSAVDGTTIEETIALIKSLLKRIKSLNKASQKNVYGVKEANVDKILQDYNEIAKVNDMMEVDIKQYLKNSTISGLVETISKTENEYYGLLAQMEKNLDDLILIEADSHLKGVYGEVITAMCDSNLLKTASKKTYAMLEKILVGQKPSSFRPGKDGGIGVNIGAYGANEILTNLMQKEKKEEAALINKKYKGNFNFYEIKSSPDKADVSITFNERDINVSVKTTEFNVDGTVTLGKDIEMLYTLSAMKEDFNNHWLNMHVSHSDINASYIKQKEADELVEQGLKYEALAHGNMLKGTPKIADGFVYIDPIMGKVFALSSYTMLTDKTYDKFILEPDIRSIKYDNDMVKAEGDDAEGRSAAIKQRIANVLFEVHKQALKVSYKVDLKKASTIR